MKEFIFGFIWAAICAWITVAVLIYLDTKFLISEDFFFPSVIAFLHSYGLSVKKVFFFAILLVYWTTSLHRYMTRFFLWCIGVIFILCVGVIVVWLGYLFLHWLANTL